jgi:two-component system, cell cycle sensor histidine kinase and response regulator CckA
MNHKENDPRQTPAGAADLRKRAEEQAGAMEPVSLSAQTPEAIQQMIHELRVHQIELEMQNEELRTAQAQIEAGRERYFNLYDLAPVGYLTLSEKGLILEANLIASTLLGTARNALVKQPISRFILKEDQDIYYLNLKKLFETGEPQECELRLLKPDGATFWAHLTATTAQTEDGTLLCRGVISDITDRKQVDEQTRFQADIIENSPVIAAYHDKDLNIVWVNRAYQKATGLSLEEVRGTKCYHVWNLSEPCRGCPVITAIETGESAANELTPDNQDHWPETQGYWLSQAAPVRDEQGTVIGALEFAIDITERKMAEEKLSVNVEKYRSLMEQSADMMYLHDLQGNILEVNQAAVSATGYLKEELLNMSAFDLHPVQSTREDIIRQWKQWEPGYSMTIEYVHIRKDGGQIPMEVTPCKVSFGGKEYIMAFVRDIAERKRAREEQEKLQAQLLQAQKMESIGILAGGIAHDFNNLLHAMGGNLELLLKDKPEDHPDVKRLKTIEKSVIRSAQLIRQLLTFSRKAEPCKQSLDLDQEIVDAARVLERSIPKMVKIEFYPGEDIRLVNADPVQIEQVLLNLGVNAADAMPEGGKLIIETRNIDLDEKFFRTHPEMKFGPYVLLTVLDTGCGIDRNTLEHIFEPFFTTKEMGKGTGLGLTSTYGIIKAHEGHISCYSEVGQGTTFNIYLPAAKQEQTDHAEAEPQEPDSLEGTETILIVDDDDEIRDLTRELMEDNGYQVLSAASGEKALEIFKQKPDDIDLVLMDLNMPGMGGRKCTTEMISIEPSVKVLVASGYSAVGHGREALEFGARDFISKPFQMREILAKIRKVLDGDKR